MITEITKNGHQRGIMEAQKCFSHLLVALPPSKFPETWCAECLAPWNVIFTDKPLQIGKASTSRMLP